MEIGEGNFHFHGAQALRDIAPARYHRCATQVTIFGAGPVNPGTSHPRTACTPQRFFLQVRLQVTHKGFIWCARTDHMTIDRGEGRAVENIHQLRILYNALYQW